MERDRNRQKVMEDIREAEMVLVGIGEEFDDVRTFREDKGYQTGMDLLADSERSFLLPAWQEMFREQQEHSRESESLRNGLARLAGILEGKNYFVVSVSTNTAIRETPWRKGRLVLPCGDALGKQCGENCSCGVQPLTEQERMILNDQLCSWRRSITESGEAVLPMGLGACPNCGNLWELNNVYHMRYNESGYLDNWQAYTGWLQGTLNRRLVVLELGVGMQFPGVIRWPFEKIAFFNQKANFYRVNEKLYQLTEEIAEKGTAIAENAVDWLHNL